jgi:hypothetical protein
VSDVRRRERPWLAVLKSILVIPLVVALVLGAGWGLVRWAQAAQAKSGRPDPQPAEQAADGSIALKFSFAAVSGELNFHGGRKPTLEKWKHLDDAVSWHFPLSQPGRYAIELELACDAADAGSVIRLEIAGQSLDVTVPATGGRHTFTTVRAGEVNIPAAGWQDLRITTVKIARQTALVLRGVRLVPVKS